MSEDVHHLRCLECQTNPTVALIDGAEVLVCHCTHVDGQYEPVELHGFETVPEPWTFINTGEHPHQDEVVGDV